MDYLFSTLNNLINHGPVLAILVSFIWGVLSILLSPCHLASIPLIVGFIDDQGKISTGRAFCISLLFGTGILITIALIGVITAATGRMLGDIGAYGNYVVSALFFVIGLHFLGFLKLSWPSVSGKAEKVGKGLLAAFILGLVFGVILGPCTFAFMAPVLGVVFTLSSTDMFYGILLLIAYGIGHTSVIVFAGTFTELIQKYLNWNEKSKGTLILKKICGILIIISAVYIIYTT
jgi:cytochrome c-type biogenesis protein